MILRLAELDDADYLLALRNDPRTRENSRITTEVERHAHIAWLVSSLADRDRRLYVAHIYGGERVGTGRLDRRHGEVELSLTVAPEHRGKGYARQIIALLVEHTNDDERLTAEIWNWNTPCLLAFVHEGFRVRDVRVDGARRWVWVERTS